MNPLLKPMYNIIFIAMSTLKKFYYAISQLALSTKYNSLPTQTQSVAILFSMFRVSLNSFLTLELYKHRRSFFNQAFKLHVLYRPFISVIDSVSSMDKKRIVNHLMSLNTLPEIPQHQSLLFQHYSESTSLILKCFNSHSDTSQNNADINYLLIKTLICKTN